MLELPHRQLTLEVIDSIQKILFPIEPSSEPLLNSLGVSHGFDPDCFRLVELTTRRQQDENDISNQFFGGWLMVLAHGIVHPALRTFVKEWLDRKRGATYVMWATSTAGVGDSLRLEFSCLAVGFFTGWVTLAGGKKSWG